MCPFPCHYLDHRHNATNHSSLRLTYLILIALGTFEVSSVTPMIFEVKCRADSKRKSNHFFSPHPPSCCGRCQYRMARFVSIRRSYILLS
ncbi:hypothetical protein BDW74DRAFT_150205 [Aspergillus multicolor]|uniref:uncharacterized protein n=1 Tax=Aspergillus multicolor TaxID=41759 RepID=UPI003CCCBC98